MHNERTMIPPLNLAASSYRLQVSQYVIVACLTLCVWDWLLALSDEFDMIRYGDRRRRFLLHGMYFIARICPIIYLVVTIILKEANIDTCKIVARFIGAANIFIMPAITSLFFVRLTAIYSYDKFVVTFFGSCWLVVLGIFIFDTTTVISRSSDAGTSKQCFVFTHTDAWGYIATAVYDTFMYLAISWRLASFAMTDQWKSRVRSFVTGGGLSGLSKVLLRSGQLYYFITIGFSICSSIFIYCPLIPPEWNGLLLEPNITVASVLGCRLFRELKLGLYAEPMTDRAISKIVFRDIPWQPSGHGFELSTLDTGTYAGGAGIWDIENSAWRDVVSEERGHRVPE